MHSWKQCALPVITTMALWQLMHLGTWCTAVHNVHVSYVLVHELPQSHCVDNWGGTLFWWLHRYCTHLASLRFEISGSVKCITYIYIYIYIHFKNFNTLSLSWWYDSVPYFVMFKNVWFLLNNVVDMTLLWKSVQKLNLGDTYLMFHITLSLVSL